MSRRVAVFMSLGCLAVAAPALAQDPAPPAVIATPTLGATPRITFAAPGTNPFLDAPVWLGARHAASPLQKSMAQPQSPDGAWKVVVTPAPSGPVTNDCQMPVIVGDTTIDPRFGKPSHAPNPMAKVATPCRSIRK